MFGKVKKWLGIEGVKVELELPENAFVQVGAISGKIRFYSQNTQEVTKVRIVLKEKYTRGRGEDKRIDEYEAGEIILQEKIIVPAEEVIEIPFVLPFELTESDMDRFERKNFLTGSIAKIAKSLHNVESRYFVEAEATVKGTALSPFDRQLIDMQ